MGSNGAAARGWNQGRLRNSASLTVNHRTYDMLDVAFVLAVGAEKVVVANGLS
jgi:hypothetical protein